MVTASRVPQKERDAAVRTAVLSDTVIRGSGSRSLADAISLIPLARSENNCQNCNLGPISITISSGDYMVVRLYALAFEYSNQAYDASEII